MKLLTLEWIPRKVTQGLTTCYQGDACQVGPYKAYINNSDKPHRYQLPYVLYLSCRTDQDKTTYHTTIEEAKQVATQELSENVHKLCTELGYILSCTSNT